MRGVFQVVMLAALAGASALPAAAAAVKADIALATDNGPGAKIGIVTFRDTSAGAKVTVQLHGLPPGQHGFHVHAKPSCEAYVVAGVAVPASGAGGHFDPGMTKMHMGPEGAGHLGDLPFLTIGAAGTDHETLLAPHITDVTALKGHAVMIHAGGDNYSDDPKPLGGGGARIACGIVE
jgi:Cu-Zn family superoxide dismutase